MTKIQKRFAQIALGFVAVTGACGSDPIHPVQPANENTLAFAVGQSFISFPTSNLLVAWCGPWEPGLITTPAVHVSFVGSGPSSAGWRLSAVVADITIGAPLYFPNDFIFDQPKKADFFVADPPNEASTARSESTGFIIFNQLNCGVGGRVSFTIAATIASEFNGGRAISVVGNLSTPIGNTPSQ